MIIEDCIIPFYLAYLMAVYLAGSIYYLIMTKQLGTPFRDSLTEEQLKIKKRESNKRGKIFFLFLLILYKINLISYYSLLKL